MGGTWVLRDISFSKRHHLVGGFNPFEKILVKLDHFPRDRGENKKYLKAPPSISRLTKGAYLVKVILTKNTTSWWLNHNI